ncbi:MAG: hypothetical protein VX589_21055 [Myxococcota bacterium]|nr:hypothetical protein [Myxococcota bacterium]
MLRTLLLILICCGAVSCRSDDDGRARPLAVEVELPDDASPALTLAKTDLEAASRRISGASSTTPANARIRVQIDADDGELHPSGYRLTRLSEGVRVEARTAVGAAYGLYHIADDLGVRYYHPEDSFFPQHPGVELSAYTGDNAQRPYFKWRGFHEHTQHPIVMSDYLLRPDGEGFRLAVSRYLKWLLRNRQNVLTFHLLNTVDLDAWVPYMAEIVDEAKTYGIRMGAVIGFVDQQQNAFRLVKPNDGEPEVQITTKMDRILDTGFDMLGFQIGTSEFTKPDEAKMLGWLNLAVSHLEQQHPGVSPFAWIHITCGLEQASGAPYYHLPLQADEGLGAYVHTTMFYDLAHPAPVYDCQDFTHQTPFFDAGDGQRELYYFPETAWWLGFDNNLPHVTPIAGRSRAYDILDVLPQWQVDGHVTFTTGREWTYWQYDYYLTKVTWDGTTDWPAYLDWIAPMYGDQSAQAVALIRGWTDLQWRDFYEINPEIYFYLAGELPQDELGESAGIIARPPKPAFNDIRLLDDVAFARWQKNDLEYLKLMAGDYGALLADWAEPSTDASMLVLELYWSYWISYQRIEHAIALYDGVVAVRQMDEAAANAQLKIAQELTNAVRARVEFMEGYYRHPLPLLARKKPKSLTAYDYGYLYETSTAFFWERRDQQLQTLIKDVFHPDPEAWSQSDLTIFRGAGAELTILEPENAILQAALGGFVPDILIALTDETPTESPIAHIAQDRNNNSLPDLGTMLELTFTADGQDFIASSDRYAIDVQDAGGMSLGLLILNQPLFRLVGSTWMMPNALELSAVVNTSNMNAIIAPFGIEPDALGELIKDIWEIPIGDELPPALPMKVRFTLVNPP